VDARLKKFPPEFISRLSEIFPPGVLPLVHNGLLTPKTTACRVNSLKTSAEKVMSFFKKENILFEQDKYLPSCLYIKKLSQKKLVGLRLYQEGEIYLQNPSSQIPPLVLAPKPGERVLDLCASPGSKTTQMAALMSGRGKIIALEPDRIRFERLCHNIKLQGCASVTALHLRAETYLKNFLSASCEEKFDRVLVDAPCSGEGTFCINHPAGFSHWSLAFVRNMAKLQKKLLSLALTLTRPGGLVCYSTCSLSPEENESVVEAVMNEHQKATLVNLSSLYKQASFKPSLTSWQEIPYSKTRGQCVRITPSEKNEGFFVAQLRVLL